MTDLKSSRIAHNLGQTELTTIQVCLVRTLNRPNHSVTKWDFGT